MDDRHMITTDNRRQARIRCRIIVENVGPTLEVSAGGLRVLTANPLSAGSEIRLAFDLPETDESLQCHGRVVHVRPSAIDRDLYEMGIQYQRMMTRHRLALEAYVNQRADDGPRN